MAGVNKVILVGRLGRDPEIYEFEGGNKKISFSLATTESYRDREGNWQDQTEWHNIVGYRYLAEKTFAKGDLVYVEGKIKTRKYTDTNGVEKYITDIVADKINILIRRNAEGYTSTGAYESSQKPADTPPVDTPPAESSAPSSPEKEEPGDDLPF